MTPHKAQHIQSGNHVNQILPKHFVQLDLLQFSHHTGQYDGNNQFYIQPHWQDISMLHPVPVVMGSNLGHRKKFLKVNILLKHLVEIF